MPDAVAPTDLAETHAQLTADAHRRTGRVPPELVATHILSVTSGGDWPLRRDALEALLRRVKAARESAEAWTLVARPRGRSLLGAYRVSVAGGKSYRAWVRSVASLEGSCECPDFVRGGLRLCKHLWWLFERGFDEEGRPFPGAHAPPALEWDAVRPLTGAGDWLARVSFGTPQPPPALRRFFEGSGAPRSAVLSAAAKRLKLVRALRAWADGARAGELRVEPALAGLLAREDAQLAERLEQSLPPKALARALRTLRRPLFPYQLHGVRRFLDAGRLLLADDMGLGKTAQAIASCHALYVTGRVKKGLLVVPAALKTQWAREWGAFTDVPVAIVDGAPPSRRAQYRRLERGFLVVNYEQVLKDWPELGRLAPDVVVLDEAQRIKNWEAKTSMYVKAMRPRWRLVLTGTPLENRLTELASILEWVDDMALEPKWRLGEWHTLRSGGPRESAGAKNLDTLRVRIAGSTLRRTRKEVLTQLPPRTDVEVPVSLTAEQLAAHAEFDLPIARLMSQARRRPLTQSEFLRLMSFFTRQRIICNGLAQRDFEETWPVLERGTRPSEATLKGLFSPKLSELRELVSSLVLTQGRKVVVFSAWKRMLRLAAWAVSDLLAQERLRAVFFTGDESPKRRTQNVVDFHDDERTRLFFATDAGGVGLNLQRAASAVIHLDLPWNPAVLEQRSGRVFRYGQTRAVQTYALVAEEGIEARIAAIIGGKKAMFDGLFDGTTDEVRFQEGSSLTSQLERLVEPTVVPAVAGPEDDDEDRVEVMGPGEAEGAPGSPPPPRSVDPAAERSAPPSLPTGFLEGIRVERLEDGRMVLEAKPEAAATFAAMLEGVAALLRQLPPPRG
jgi:hypothetical protein